MHSEILKNLICITDSTNQHGDEIAGLFFF